MDLQMVGKGRGSHGERLDVEGQWRRVSELFIPAELGYREQNKAIACVKKRFYQKQFLLLLTSCMICSKIRKQE